MPYAYYLYSASATPAGISFPSTANCRLKGACAPPLISSISAEAAHNLAREEMGTGEVKRNVLRPKMMIG